MSDVHVDAQKLADYLVDRFGSACKPYAQSDLVTECGASFTIDQIEATFSFVCGGDLPPGIYSVQVEGVPPGDYIFIAEVSFSEIGALIDSFMDAPDKWPTSG
jgi:hypothetical protein